jgi:hypothetical protein
VSRDLVHFSAVVLMALFAIPAIAGVCLAVGECPVPVASNCHDEEREQAESCCCGVEAVQNAKGQTLKHKDSVWLVESPQLLGAAGNDPSALHSALVPPPPLDRHARLSRNRKRLVLADLCYSPGATAGPYAAGRRGPRGESD